MSSDESALGKSESSNESALGKSESSNDSAIGKSGASNDTTTTDDNCEEHSETSENIHDSRVSKNVTNPFDSNLLDSLNHTTFSPSIVLKTPLTKPRVNASFQWSIEQRSRLFPAAIDESFVHESPDNPEYEKKVQRALDNFWNSNALIAPSPDVLGSSSAKIKPLNFTPSPIMPFSSPDIFQKMKPLDFTPSPIVPLSRRNSSRILDSSESPVSSLIALRRVTKEVQTDISIPVDFDLAELLSKHLSA